MENTKQINNRKPWSMQKELQNPYKDITTPNEILNIVYGIRKDRLRSLFVLTYLTAGRIRELIQYKHYKDKKNVHPSIKRKDIHFTKKDGRDVMLIKLRNLKQKENSRRRIKEIPITLDNEFHRKLVNSIMDYISQKEMDEELFPFKYQFAYKNLFKKICNPHWLRHIRLTHLIKYHDFSDLLLQRYAGWSNTKPASIYSELRWGDFLDKY